MRTDIFSPQNHNQLLFKTLKKFNGSFETSDYLEVEPREAHSDKDKQLPEIVFMTSYPPRECGIATYSMDFMNALKLQFGQSFSYKAIALENKDTPNRYSNDVKYILQTSKKEQYEKLAYQLNADKNIKLVFIQHEFGLFGGEYGDYLLTFLTTINKPVITTFHTVLPNPDKHRMEIVQTIASLSQNIIVMTKNAGVILKKDYNIPSAKIKVISHGTHLVSSFNSQIKKRKHNLENRLILSTFGLLNSGKSIETAIDAMPAIIEQFPKALYLILGKTHPGIVNSEGEKYREFLQQKVIDLKLQNHVKFLNKFLSHNELMEYLQCTDIYLFTSKDPYQAVSGTFASALSCGCPIISTPIPHATEVLDGAGIIFDFCSAHQLAGAAIRLLSDPILLLEMRLNALHKISPTSWQNSAVAHCNLFINTIGEKIGDLKYENPKLSLAHLKRMTTHNGIIQFACISIPDLDSGYTLDDNARALIAVTKYYESTGNASALALILPYLSFIIYCQQPDGKFLNYVDKDGNYYAKNSDENLEDSNGRALWALGEFISSGHLFNYDLVEKATTAFEKHLKHILGLHSPRAIAFAIKGLYHYNLIHKNPTITSTITALAYNLVSKYKGVSDATWHWYEEYLTYANSLLPEAMHYAYLSTGNEVFKMIAESTFDFLLSIIFRDGQIKVVSNQGWHTKGQLSNNFGEQPIDVAYTILALGVFYDTYKTKNYLQKMKTAFNWFLGQNHLQQIVYNPCTGGCYDGLEENHLNLNQGAESTVSYLLARLTMERYFGPSTQTETQLSVKPKIHLEVSSYSKN